MKKQSSLIWLLFFVNICLAQNSKITISVSDSKTNQRLPYASIYLTDSRSGTLSDINGNATILLDKTNSLDTLICSYVGYKTKRMSVSSIKNSNLKIALIEEITYLDEVVIKGKRKTYTPLQIVKKAIKKTKNNYYRNSTYLLGFYREIVSEDKVCIELNEAKIKLHYSGYPQKYFVRKSWRNYWDRQYELDFLFAPGAGIFPEAQFFMYYNSIKDQSEIVKYRISENHSKYGIEPTPKGGILSLTATDKIKYREDFFNRRNFKKYSYNLKGVAYHNDTLCYIIHFYPNKMKNNYIFQNYSKKMKGAIWVGNLYISVNSFAVIGMEYEFSSLSNFAIYKNNITTINHINVDYGQKNGFWHLQHVKTKQTNTYEVQDSIHNYECIRELWIDSVIYDNVHKISNKNLLQHKVYSSLRFFNPDFDFDEKFWETYDKHKLADKIKKELTKNKSLNEQYKDLTFFNDSLTAPIAKKVSSTKHYYQDTLYDDYSWIEQKDNPLTINYIEEENQYTNNFFLPLKTQTRNLYNKTRNILLYDTTKVNSNHSNSKFKWVYNDKYPKFVKSEENAPDKVLFNLLDYKAKYKNFLLSNLYLSPDSNYISYSYSVNGDFAKTLTIKSVNNSEVKYDSIIDMYEYLWLNDSLIVYTTLDETKRCNSLFLHNIKAVSSDTLLLLESDPNFEFTLTYSNNKKLILLYSESKSENELYYFDISSNQPTFLVKYNTRSKDVISKMFCDNDSIYILSNVECKNNQIYSIGLHNNSKTLVISNEEKKKLYIDNINFTKSYYIVTEVFKANYRIRVVDKNTFESYYLDFPDKVFDIEKIAIDKYNLDRIKVYYSSVNTPFRIYNINLKNKEYEIAYKSNVSKTFRKKDYIIKKVFVQSRDKKKIPLIIAYNKRKNKKHKGLVLNVYGAYGSYPDNGFYSENIALMDNGYTIALPYVRGSIALGQEWYDGGKTTQKINTFNDFIDCAEYLIKNDYTTSDFLVGYAHSAGCLALAYVANERPELFNTLIFDHPYLDVLNTMMNDSLALTTIEYTEWGNPSQDIQVYDYIKKYSPYQNIKRQDYPNMFFKAGFKDLQTPYWQIIKHIAKLRDYNTGKSQILLSTDMYSGHRGNITPNSWIINFSKQFTFVNNMLGLNIVH